MSSKNFMMFYNVPIKTIENKQNLKDKKESIQKLISTYIHIVIAPTQII